MSRARTKHSRSGKSSLIQFPEGLPLSPSVHQAPAGVPADIAAAYSQLFLPLSVAASFLSIPKPPNPGADLLEPCAEALEAARKQVEKFLRQEETRLRAESPGVFEVANEILDYTKALVVELPINRAGIEEAIAANSPPEQLQDRLRESRERLADKCRRHRGPDPVQTLLSLLDRLRSAISKWAADTKRLDQSRPGPKLPAGDQEAVHHPSGPRVVKRNINARMLETIQANVAALGWNSRQWAKHLKCAKSSVVGTQTWKDLSMRRERERAERALDRRRRPKLSDQRRD